MIMNRRLSGKKRMTIRRLAAVALALGMVILYMPGLAYAEDSTDVTAESASATEAADTSSSGTSASGSAEKNCGYCIEQRECIREHVKERIKKENCQKNDNFVDEPAC